ncbi:LOW QUALITY PROTEIN: PHD finger protein 7-like [Molothrus ater]|uniref:LOW QUALITY PROTEIN: PHD finger protein 7-like n=1 Tax=Molothrus ater TaxID=84834 RepID=UPI0023E78360|nr:LOW QUALITY PROTEIN: PHD finger protein 7-like [Molothrus ater]
MAPFAWASQPLALSRCFFHSNAWSGQVGSGPALAGGSRCVVGTPAQVSPFVGVSQPLVFSFCPEHRPEQEVEVTPEPDTICSICLEPVEDRMTFTTLVCPMCKRAWFHRDCIQVGALPSALGQQVLSSSSSSSRASLTLPVFALQGQAMSAGLLCLKCPLCRDSETFLVDLFLLGIRIPFRQPTWEDNDAFAELGVRHGQCNARDCLYPGGREEAEEEGPWQLLLCSSCAAEGTHRRCSGLRNSTDRWECDTCAGLGTGMGQTPVSLGWGQCPGQAWQSASTAGGLGALLWPGLAWAWGAFDIPACPYSLQG